MVRKADGPADPAEVRAALVDLAGWLAHVQGDEGWLAALRFGVAGALARAAEPALAEQGYHRILSENPKHLWAWVGLIDLAMAAQLAPKAADLGRAALAAMPDAPILRRKTAEALEHAEGPDAAIAFLDLIAGPPEGAAELAYAIALLRKAGRVAETGPICDALLAMRPEDALAHLARIEMWLSLGDDAAAHEAAHRARALHPDHPEIRLRAAQVFFRRGQTAEAAALIAPIPDDPTLAAAFVALSERLTAAMPAPEARETDTTAARLAALDAALAGAVDGPEVERLVAGLAEDPDLPWYHALGLVARRHAARRGDLRDRLAAAFGKAPWAPADRLAFDVEYVLLRDGPLCALDRLRQERGPARDPEAAERLGRVLLQAGQATLAARYLGLCLRRWPMVDSLVELTCRALVAAGLADRVDPLLTRQDGPLSPGRIMYHRLSAALAMGREDLALAICAADLADFPPDPPLPLIIAVHLLTGDLAGAEACLARLAGTEGPLEAALIQRPRATRLGTLLNEARILAAMGAGADAGGAGPTLSRDFFLPARACIAAVRDRPEVALAPPPATGTVHLLWSDPGPGTPEGQRLAAAWAEGTGRKVKVFSQTEAQDWLAAEIGPDAVKAHRLTRDPAQRADLLLYACLWRSGGVGLGAPQWPARGIRPWLDAIGPRRLFRDEWGAPGTAMILAVPGDPVIGTACDMAVAACLARENDHRWFKTGPGLLARALAQHLGADTPPLAPLQQLRRHAHPYGGSAD